MHYTLHEQKDIARLWTERWEAKSIEEMKSRIEAEYGPFPLLFHVPPLPIGSPGVVMTGIVHVPGFADRPDVPFFGACILGYVPITGHSGEVVVTMGTVKAANWDQHVKPTPVEPQELVNGIIEEPT